MWIEIVSFPSLHAYVFVLFVQSWQDFWCQGSFLPTGFSALSCVYCLMSLVTSLSNVIYSNGLIFVFPGTNLNIMTLILFVSHARLFGFLTLSLRTSKAVTKSRILYFPYLQCHCTVFCYCCCFCIKLGINSFCSFYLISAALMASLMWPTTPMC